MCKDYDSPMNPKHLDLLSVVSSSLAHKVNNPLTYVMNYMFILKETVKDEGVLRMIEKMEQGVIRSKDILQQFVDITNPAPVALEPISLKRLIDDLSLEFTGRGMTVTVDITDNVRISANEECMRTVFNALIINSSEAGATQVKISAIREGEDVSISVRDDGGGIPREQMDRLFYPFSSSRRGTDGMGLYTCYVLCHLMQGSIRCAGSDTSGTEFVLSYRAA